MSDQQQGKLLPMVKFREIIRLHDLGYNQTEIARSCLTARSTVQDYIRRASAKGLRYAQLQGRVKKSGGKLENSFFALCLQLMLLEPQDLDTIAQGSVTYLQLFLN